MDSGELQWTPVDSGDTFVSPLSFLWVFHWSPLESSDIRGGVKIITQYQYSPTFPGAMRNIR